MVNACGAALYQVFAEAGVGMELEGVAKPELRLSGYDADGKPMPATPHQPACDVETLPEPAEEPEQVTAPVAAPESAASGLQAFNLEDLLLLIQ